MDNAADHSSEGPAHAETLAQPLGTQETLSSGGVIDHDAGTPGGSQSTPRRRYTDDGRRDIVAAVIYYNGARALYGADEAAMREAGLVPPLLGKYPVDRVLGKGGKGAVLLGRNPDLDEEVAIKVLRQDNLHDLESEGVRLLREARVLAKLAHPNIVPIHDAGEADGDLYIVMHRVRGATLRDTQQGKTWQQIVDLYVQAGRGLAAVHAAGLVHRDFKADNVLVDADGQVMLADFGLVCLAGEPDASGVRRAAAHGSLEAFARQVTQTGEVHGTPAYMAPEAIGASPPSAHGDMFSFGASLFEALHGVLPFPGSDVMSLYLAASEGRMRPRPEDSSVPEWLDAVVRQTLRAEPSQRPPTIDALLVALDFRARDRAQAEARARLTRIRRFLGVGVGAAASGLLLGALLIGPEDPCARPTATIAALWNDEASARLARTGDSGLRLAGLLDNYVDTWAGTFSTICQATHTEHTQSSELHDARMDCLEQRKRELGAVTLTLEGAPEAPALDDALLVAASLDSPRPCAQAGRVPQPSAAQAAEVADLSQQVAEVRARELAGDYKESRDLALTLLVRARALGHEPLVAEVLLALGRAHWLVGDGEAARAALTEASDLAEHHGLDTLAADLTSLLTKVAALSLRDSKLGHEWARQAGRKLARIDGDPWRQAELLSNRGLLAYHLDADYPQAKSLHEQALQQRQTLQQDGGETRLQIAESYLNRGNVLAAMNDITGSIADYQEGRRILGDLLGPEHPRIGALLYSEAAEHRNRGHRDLALASATDAVAILRHSDPNSLLLAHAYYLLSAIQVEHKSVDAALHSAQNALAVAETHDAVSPGEIAMMHGGIGGVRLERKEHALALAAFNDGLAALAAAPAPERDIELSLRFARGELSVEMGRLDAARVDFAAVDALIRTDPALAIHRPYLAKGLARVHLGLGEPALAIPFLEDALAALPSEGNAELRAELEVLLTQARAAAKTRPRSIPT
jgi:serine/threonine protein kinase/tetratricopeptide (TPR) repeat protein